VRRRESVGPSKLLAEKVLKKKKVLVAENKHLDIKRQKKMKFKVLAKEYLDRHCKRTLQQWYKSSRSNVNNLNKFLGNKYLQEITQRDVEKYVDYRLQHYNPRNGKRSAPNTVNKDLGALRNMFNKAIEWEYFNGRNPVQGFKFLKVDNKRVRFLEKEEIKRLLNECEGHAKDIVEVALNTGMQQGEIFNLKWHDIDIKRGLIHILKTKNNEKREMPINDDVRGVLYRVKKDPNSPYVFANYDGKPFNDIKRSFCPALKRSKINDFRLHDLRNTFASQLVMASADLLTVKELPGHKTMEMTLRYSHLNSDHKMSAVQRLNLQNRSIGGTNVAQIEQYPTEDSLLSEVYSHLSSD
jgi:integrase